jgi:hypothetical protein
LASSIDAGDFTVAAFKISLLIETDNQRQLASSLWNACASRFGRKMTPSNPNADERFQSDRECDPNRALVGPFASAKKAATLCGGLKAASGDCVIQKN